MLDTLVASNLYPNRSEALRMATWKFLHESVAMLRAVPAIAPHKVKDATSAKKEPTSTPPEVIPAAPADLDEILDEISGDKANGGADADPFDEIVREQQHA
jgi:Arc/MetJ-type ribon-helix-helix transcriptional regulator